MGSMTFDRLMKIEGSVFNHFSFDSSPQFSLSKALGTDPSNFELKEVSETDKKITYEVHAGPYPSSRQQSTGEVPLRRLVGTLVYEKPEARWARLG